MLGANVTRLCIIRLDAFVERISTYILSVYSKNVHLVEFARHRDAGLPYARGTQSYHLRRRLDRLRLVGGFLLALLFHYVNNSIRIIVQFPRNI